MILNKIDLDYWQQRQMPGWAKDLQQSSKGVSIDQIVNKNATPNYRRHTSKVDMDPHNALHLLMMVRKNQAYERNRTGESGNLIDYMLHYTQQDGRKKLYTRWARRFFKMKGIDYERET